ncbi:30S ribosomal protein S17 [Candidatus Woesearchaeota archaeon]|nr:30S ribosomal protein S17 [Candidatus Woesearchaeota archaeon]
METKKHAKNTAASKKEKSIGLDVAFPQKTCNEEKCPFHGNLKVHGRVFVGTVIKDVFHKTATIEFPRQFYVQKYERYEKRRTRIKAHVPGCIGVMKGDLLMIAETRPLSKTKNFVAVEVIKQ